MVAGVAGNGFPERQARPGQVLRARDVVVCEVLPGPGHRMRAAGKIGELAGARGRAPQFGAALAQAGGKGQSGLAKPIFPAGNGRTARAPLKLYRQDGRACRLARPCARQALGSAYGVAGMTASSYLPEPMPVSAKMPWSAIHLKVSS